MRDLVDICHDGEVWIGTDGERICDAELYFLEENKKLNARLDAGHEYLMTTNSLNLTVENALEAFGFRRDGLSIAL